MLQRRLGVVQRLADDLAGDEHGARLVTVEAVGRALDSCLTVDLSPSVRIRIPVSWQPLRKNSISQYRIYPGFRRGHRFRPDEGVRVATIDFFNR